MAKDEKEGEEEEESDSESEDDGVPSDVTVILDNGSGFVKAGLSSDAEPKHVFPGIIGRPRPPYKDKHTEEVYFHEAILNDPNHFFQKSPMENGVIENFEDMEKLWENIFFDVLNINPMKHPLILTEPPYNPKKNREESLEIMFETFGVPSLNISIQGVLALLGHGRTSGVVLGSGDGVSSTMPIFDGYGLPHCINRMDLAGKELNTILAKMISKQNISLTKSSDKLHLGKMKEEFCYIAAEPNEDTEVEKAAYKMPDGQQIVLGHERWQVPETLFHPIVGGLDNESMGVANMVWDTVQKCEMDTRRTLLSNIVLSGGSTMFPGFAERMKSELLALAPSNSHSTLKVVKSKNPLTSDWTGGQIYSNLRAMQEDKWISIEDYDEYGAQYIHEKIAVRYK